MDKSGVCSRIECACSARILGSAQNLVELHQMGTTREQIEDALRILPFVSFAHVTVCYRALSQDMSQHPAMIRAVEKLKAASTIQTNYIVLSNSNSIFISTILEVRARSFPRRCNILTTPQDRGLTHLFDRVITNPAEWDPSGLLKLRRRVDPNGPQHNCKVGCSANMCKGWSTVSEYISSVTPIFV